MYKAAKLLFAQQEFKAQGTPWITMHMLGPPRTQYVRDGSTIGSARGVGLDLQRFSFNTCLLSMDDRVG